MTEIPAIAIPGTDAIVAERNGSLCILRFSRPPVNAMRFADWRAFTSFYSGLSGQGVTVAVLTGLPGPHFCAGNDITEFANIAPQDALSGSNHVRDAVLAVRRSPIVSVAALHGVAYGAGMMLASGCDIRFGIAGGRIGLPEVKVGAFGGYRIAQEVLPAAEARRLALGGEPMSHERAHSLGFIQDLYPTTDALWQATIAEARLLSDRLIGPLAGAAKTAIFESAGLYLDAGFDREIKTGSNVLSGDKAAWYRPR